MSYLSKSYLIDSAGPDFHYVWPAVIFFLLMGMLATTYAYPVEQQNNKRAPLTRMARKVQTWAWTLAVVGLVLIAFRVADARIPFAESRLLLYLVSLGFLVLLGYVVWFLRFVLPDKNAAYEANLLRRQYAPRSRRRR